MKKVISLSLFVALMTAMFVGCSTKETPKKESDKSIAVAKEEVLGKNTSLRLVALGQGVAPTTTISPAQAYALAKKAAVADAYKILAEKVKGVRIEGEDIIGNMMIKKSSIHTSVNAMIKGANIVETNFKDGLCEVEVELTLSHSQFTH